MSEERKVIGQIHFSMGAESSSDNAVSQTACSAKLVVREGDKPEEIAVKLAEHMQKMIGTVQGVFAKE